MENFWDFSVWGGFNLAAVLLISLLTASCVKKVIKPLRYSLIPTSVLAGGLLLIVSGIYRLISGNNMFETAFFGGNGIANLEIITYHALALGFIASGLKTNNAKMTKKRTMEIFDSGVTTVATYLIQGIFGLGITIVAAFLVKGFFAGAGILLPFGFGQGTGQALNYGGIFEMDFGFAGGKSFGLTIAALGFLSASIGGVIHLHILKKQGKIEVRDYAEVRRVGDGIDSSITIQGSLDNLTVQIAIIALAYFISYLIILLLGTLVPGFKSVIYGFNFIIGVLSATLVKTVMNFLRKKEVLKREYTNNFLLTRCSNFFFDVMVTAGIAAIRFGVLKDYWGIMIILGVVGLAVTYYYNRIIAKTLFKEYEQEQFLAMYGMLTGTASTGVILLREIDPEFKSPASDNLIYQTFPAIVFGFPMMLIATLAPVKPFLTFVILVVFFAVMNVLLFRRQIFRKKAKAAKTDSSEAAEDAAVEAVEAEAVSSDSNE
ncbi:MAG: hypothetical protein E7660_04720 [Ruminococcaceae bacterium]|nr:hypothetical protein [Oscillospiraceae bacterium]